MKGTAEKFNFFAMSCYRPLYRTVVLVPHNEKLNSVFAKYLVNDHVLFSFSKADFNHDIKGTYA